jgi:catechol 2,3-dioxygenase-like lactoylglutathione lyase family enzyme
MSLIQAQYIRAIGLTGKDVERAQHFYIQALGFQWVSDLIVGQSEYSPGVVDKTLRIVTLQLGDEYIKLMQSLTLQGEAIPDDSRSHDLWFQHLAIAVSDMDRAYSHLKPFLTESISPAPQTIPQRNQAAAGVRAFKFRDPDRHPLELIWFPPEKGQDKWHQLTDQTDQLFLGVDHSAIVIADTDQSLQFYRDLLGMQINGGSLNAGETQADLDGLPEAKVRVTALRPAQGGLGIELLDYLVLKDARPMPLHWSICDIAYCQVEVIVNNLEQIMAQLRQQGVPFSTQWMQPLSGQPLVQGCLMKDPNGHALLLHEV